MKKDMLIEMIIMGVVMVLVIGVGAIVVNGMVTKKIIKGIDSEEKTDTAIISDTPNATESAAGEESTNGVMGADGTTGANAGTEAAEGETARDNCVSLGGRITEKETPNGEKYEICAWEDNRQCEIEALLAGDCPTGGRRITGYGGNEALIYCAIRGGESDMDNNTCVVGGETCGADDYYNGECKN